MEKAKLVYSTDPLLNRPCKQCKELVPECVCPDRSESVQSRNFTATLRVEKQGRGGKTVTVIDGLPKVGVYLKDLTKRLKNACGSGGTFSLEGKEGRIEIQGDQRERIRTLLAQEGIRTKG
jgi:translation initiation factor 1